MHTHVTRLLLLPLIVLTLLVGACQPTAPAALPRLDDPAEIVEEALRTTAELDFAHVRLDASASGGQLGNQAMSYVIEGDIDLDRRDFHLVTEGNMGAAVLGTQRVEMLLVGTEAFVRYQGMGGGLEGSDKWMRTSLGGGQDPRAGIPPNPAIAVALRTILEGEGIDTTLTGMEACGEAQCYALKMTIDPELITQALGGVLFGMPGGVGGELDPEAVPDPAIPEIVLDVRIDEATRRLVSLSTSVTYEGTVAEVTATLSNHDVKVTFLPPPPDQVDDNSGGIQQQILEQVGNEVEPS